MFLLFANVLRGPLHAIHADAEGPIPLLPIESVVGRKVFMHPIRGLPLDCFEGIGDGLSRGEREQHMNVIVGTTDGDHFHGMFASDSSQEWEESLLPVICNDFLAILGAEDAMIKADAK